LPQCDVPVCSWCLLDGAHIGETCENLPLYVENRQGKLRERMAQLDGVMAQMDGYGQQLKEQPEQLAGWADKTREQIAAHFTQLREAMDDREQLLNQKVAEVERQLKEDSSDRTTALERTMVSVRELSLTCGQVLEHPNPYVFVEWAPQLNTQMDELTASESVRAVQNGKGADLPVYDISGPAPDDMVAGIGLVMEGQAQPAVATAASTSRLQLVPDGDAGAAELAADGAAAGGGVAAAGGMSPPTPSVANQYSVSARGSAPAAGAAAAAGPGMVSVPATSGPRVLTVGENYQYPSIGLAVEAAGPGDNIIVFEGRYREAITLTKPVEIMGVGVLNDIVVECSDSRPVVWSWAQYAKVLNLSLVQLNKNKTEAVDCVKVDGGSFYMDGCSVTAGSAAGVVVGNETLGEVKRTKIHSCATDGIRIESRSNCFVEGCLVTGNAHAELLVTDAATGTIRNNKFIGTAGAGAGPAASGRGGGGGGGGQSSHGILVENGGKATVENNEVCKHAEPEIEVWGAGAEVMSVGNNIHSSLKSGVFVHTSGLMTSENNNIYKHKKVGLQVKNMGRLLSTKDVVRANVHGIWL
jgi:parallel beta-helix repeat protein